MIVKLFKSGKSFKTLGAYLLHDAGKAETAERVNWTHTLNLASDHPGLAIDEMLWTVRGADDLKREAGVKPGGRPLENPVRHFSLNWHPSEKPSREHMIEAVESFLAHMGAGEHQALITNHTDKKHAHVHVMYSAVDPNTGRALDTSFEKRRAQEWALAYEREHQLIFCEERLKPITERTQSPTRATWEKLRASERDADRIETKMLAREFAGFAAEIMNNSPRDLEWMCLKTIQRAEREQFFRDGKEAYRAVRNYVFREVREEFREEWRGYFEAKRAGGDRDDLVAIKSDLLRRQTIALDEQRKEAYGELRDRRDAEYEALLERQRQDRAELRGRQADGYPTTRFLVDIARRQEQAEASPQGVPHPRGTTRNTQKGFRHAADEVTKEKGHDRAPKREAGEPFGIGPSDRRLRVNSGLDAVGGIGLGALGALAAIGERLFDGFFGGGEAASEDSAPIRPDDAEDARKDRAQETTSVQRANETRAEEEARLVASWEARREKQRSRD